MGHQDYTQFTQVYQHVDILQLYCCLSWLENMNIQGYNGLNRFHHSKVYCLSAYTCTPHTNS